jgi:hypothetical protein
MMGRSFPIQFGGFIAFKVSEKQPRKSVRALEQVGELERRYPETVQGFVSNEEYCFIELPDSLIQEAVNIPKQAQLMYYAEGGNVNLDPTKVQEVINILDCKA